MELPALPLGSGRASDVVPRTGLDPVGPRQGLVNLDSMVEVVSEPQVEVEVHVGKSRIFELKKPVSRVFLANPSIANVRFLDQEQPVPKLLDVYGLSFGATTLTIWDLDDHSVSLRVRVTIDTQDLERRLTRIFPGVDVRISQIGSQIILEGQVPDAKTMSEVLQVVQAALLGQAASIPIPTNAPRISARDDVIAASYQDPKATNPAQGQAAQPTAGPTGVQGGVVANPVEPGEIEQMPAASDFQGGQMAGGSPMGSAVSTRVAQGPYVSVRAGGGLLASGTIVNRVRVPGPRQILLKVKIAELNRTAIREIGANFHAIIGNNQLNSVVGQIGEAGAQIVGIFDSSRFTAYVNALRQNQLARILAEPNLVALDGQPARFIAGGSFPFPVPQAGVNGANVITIQFRDFGAILQFVPHIISDDAIRLDVAPSFSELNFGAGTSVNGTTVPGINQRSARTVVELREGQTLAIGGLLSTKTQAFTTRIPLLGDTPIIGPFFSRDRIETQETELVVLVTPQLVEGLEANEVPPAPGDWYKEPTDCEFYLLGRIEGRTGNKFRATIQELDPFQVMRQYRSENHWVVGSHGHAE